MSNQELIDQKNEQLHNYRQELTELKRQNKIMEGALRYYLTKDGCNGIYGCCGNCNVSYQAELALEECGKELYETNEKSD